ncbi:uncharacterized protein V1516DRAFT_683224 [Lipomyces oligophaga]|uniref:uncharacterized protein n=1 Tax=Lipomyces oligophaga TaxID=45792 RepID=UPI0034CEDF3B
MTSALSEPPSPRQLTRSLSRRLKRGLTFSHTRSSTTPSSPTSPTASSSVFSLASTTTASSASGNIQSHDDSGSDDSSFDFVPVTSIGAARSRRHALSLGDNTLDSGLETGLVQLSIMPTSAGVEILPPSPSQVLFPSSFSTIRPTVGGSSSHLPSSASTTSLTLSLSSAPSSTPPTTPMVLQDCSFFEPGPSMSALLPLAQSTSEDYNIHAVKVPLENQDDDIFMSSHNNNTTTNSSDIISNKPIYSRNATAGPGKPEDYSEYAQADEMARTILEKVNDTTRESRDLWNI